MASSRDTRNGPDWRDVAASMEQMVGEYGEEIEIVLRPSIVKRQPSISVEVRAALRAYPGQDPEHLASVKSDMLTTRATGFEMVLLLLLYDLDSKLTAMKGSSE